MGAAGTGVLSELLRSLEGLRNRKAISLLMGGFVLAALLLALAARVGFESVAIGIVIGFVGILCAFFGLSAAGIVLMDDTRGRAQSSYADAILLGSLAFAKLVVGSLGLLLALVGVHFVVAALIYVCKFPGIGPLLFAILLPAMLLVMAMIYLGAWACFSLLAPALWDGNALSAAFARVYAIGANRSIQFIVAWLAASVLLTFVLVVLVGALTGATAGVGGTSLRILGADLGSFGMDALSGFGGPRGLGGSLIGRRGGDDAFGYVIAGTFGVAIAWAIMLSAFGSVALMATCIVYVGLSDGLDTKAAEEYLAGRISQAKEKAAQLQELAKQRATEAQARAREAAQQRSTAAPAAAPPPATVAAGARCPACAAPLQPGQAFCGECGHRLGAA
jgi:hypothetical protein